LLPLLTQRLRAVVPLNWTVEKSFEDHLINLRQFFVHGRDVLKTLRRGTVDDLYIYYVRDTDPDESILHRNLPRHNDP
jgi:hypothetical protein